MSVENSGGRNADKIANKSVLRGAEFDRQDKELASCGFSRMKQNEFHPVDSQATIILRNGIFYFGLDDGKNDAQHSEYSEFTINVIKQGSVLVASGKNENGIGIKPIAKTKHGYINGGEHGFILTKDEKMLARFAFMGDFVLYAGRS